MIADTETLENNQNAESDTIETKKIKLENIRKEKITRNHCKVKSKMDRGRGKTNQVFLQLGIKKLYYTKPSQKSKKKMEA